MEPVWSSRYALTRRTQLEIGSKSRSFWIVMPYSISVPITLGIAIGSPHGPASSGSEVLTRVDVLDRPFLAADSRDQRAHVDDPLTLATGDPGPVVGVRGVRQVLVLLELLADRLVDVFRLDPALAGVDQPLHGLLLGARDDVLDHRTAREVLEVEDLALALRVGDLEELVLVGRRVHALDGLRDQAAHDLRRVAAPALLRLLVERQIGGEVLREDVVGGLAVRPVHLDLEVEAAGPQHRRVDQVLAVAGADHDHVLQRLDAVDLRQELRHHGGLHVGGDARPAHAEERVHLVEEDHDGHVLAGLLARPLEHLADLVLRLADILVEQLRTLHVEEVGRRLAPGALLDALREAVRDRLRDERLAAARRAVEQDALRRRELVVREDVRVEVRQLDGVAQDLDLLVEAADVLVRDVGDLLERHLLHRRLRHLLEGVLGARVQQDRVAGLERLAPERPGQRDDPLVVRVAEHDGAVVAEQLHDRRDLAAVREPRRLHDVERLVQHAELPFLELEGVELRVDVHAHRLAVHRDLGGAVLVGPREDPVRVWRRAPLVDLLLQELDLLLRLLQRVHQLLVLALRVGELVARELVAAPQRLVLRQHAVETATELDRISAEEAHRLAKVLDLFLQGTAHGSLTLRFDVLRSAEPGGRDATHHVAHEAAASRTRVELAHDSLSRLDRRTRRGRPLARRNLQGPCRGPATRIRSSLRRHERAAPPARRRTRRHLEQPAHGSDALRPAEVSRRVRS